jgi:CheY-like chemotaxis protein
MFSKSWKEKIILIVEDDEVSLEFLKELLIPSKVKLLVARDGIEAIETAKKRRDIDLILMDVQLPSMSGKDSMIHIREFNEEVPIIAQTAFAMSGDREKYLEMGFDDYISKPINVVELIEMIERHFD